MTDQSPESPQTPPSPPSPQSPEKPERRPAKPFWPRSGNPLATVLIGALLAILGFALAVQLRSNAATDSLSSAREDDLVRILDDQNSRIDRLQSQITDLQAAKARLSDSGSSDEAARQEAQRQSDALAVLTGTAAAHGPGVRVAIADPGGTLRAEDLLDVVEELRGAGAEVIQFGPVRIGTSSAFTDGSSGIVLDGQTLQAPYEVLAIGDPKTMDTALNIPTGVVSVLRNAGGQASVTEQDSISITALRTVRPGKFASPAPR